MNNLELQGYVFLGKTCNNYYYIHSVIEVIMSLMQTLVFSKSDIAIASPTVLQ